MIDPILEELGVPNAYVERCRPLRCEEAEPQQLQDVGPDCFGRPQRLLAAAAEAWRAMRAAARADGIELELVSAYRSIEYQADLIRKKLAADRTIEDVLTVNAAPGYSEHHTGRAIDLSTPGAAPLEESFERTEAFRWLERHAWRYGFHMSYPRDNPWGVVYEPWHWAWCPEARREIVACNFAEDSENRIHADEVAARYGFAGGLVPGVASYAYVTQPALELLGPEWLAGGRVKLKLTAPVYDGERVVARAWAVPTRDAERAAHLELRGPDGVVRAVGEAAVGTRDEAPEEPVPALERRDPPPLAERPEATLDILAEGTVLATLDLETAFEREGGPGGASDTLRPWLAERYREQGSRYLSPDGPLPPAIVPDLANQVLARTVRLGPWIHAASRTRHLGLLHPEDLEARGRVERAYRRRGHEIVELLVALYRRDECVAVCRHRALIRPARRRR